MPFQRFASAWPLFFGVAMMMGGNGLLSTLLGVRATHEGFSTLTTGLIMSFYFVGYMTGSHMVPKLLKNVGHIRVFSALAATASVTALLHGLFVTPLIWMLVRACSGFAYAGLYVVVESWLNDIATKQTRGRIIAVYLVMTYIGLATGQLMLNLADPGRMDLFAAVSMLISISLIPIALSNRPAPEFHTAKAMSPRELFHLSPLGTTTITLSGFSSSVLTSIGTVYAAHRGFSTGEISIFIAVMIMGGVTFQIPVGLLSDRFDRRKLIMLITGCAGMFSLLCMTFSGAAHLPFYICAFLLGGCSMTIYGVASSYTNDRLEPSQYVGASACMMLLNGSGAICGPASATALMSLFGNNAFFPIMSCIYLTSMGFAVYRALVNPAPPQHHRKTAENSILPEGLGQ